MVGRGVVSPSLHVVPDESEVGAAFRAGVFRSKCVDDVNDGVFGMLGLVSKGMQVGPGHVSPGLFERDWFG